MDNSKNNYSKGKLLHDLVYHHERKVCPYKLIVRPTLIYVSVVWVTATDCHMCRLQFVQNPALRVALDAR